MGGVKKSAVLDVGYPIYAAKFINNKTVLVAGGGGEGNNGIPNKITAVKCFFKSTDKTKVLQKFREITLPKNEDSPMCLDISKEGANDDGSFSVFVGCNQSTQLIQSMNINNNLRKYTYSKDEHLRFLDAAQLDVDDVRSPGAVNANGSGDYPKIVYLSSNNNTGCFMTSKLPSTIYIFDPEVLDTKFKYQPKDESIEIKDLHLSPDDDGKTICYITSKSTIETVSTITSNPISTSSSSAKTQAILSKYILSKVKYVDNEHVLITATGKPGSGSTGITMFLYRLTDHSIVRQKVISTKIKGVTGIDVSVVQDLVALAGNDTSLTIVRLSDFKTIQVFKKLHAFAITRLAFSPNGTSLASVSAANSLHVMKLQPNYSKSRSTVGTIFNYLIMIVLVAILSVALQKGYENGQLNDALQVSQKYGLKSFKLANEYAALGISYVKDKLKDEDHTNSEESNSYFKMDEWNDESEVETATSIDYDPKGLTISSDHIEISFATSTTPLPNTDGSKETSSFTRHIVEPKEDAAYSSQDYVSLISEIGSTTTQTTQESISTEISSTLSEISSVISETFSSIASGAPSSHSPEIDYRTSASSSEETNGSVSESIPESVPSSVISLDEPVVAASGIPVAETINYVSNTTLGDSASTNFEDPNEDFEEVEEIVVEEYVVDGDDNDSQNETDSYSYDGQEDGDYEIIEEVEEEEVDGEAGDDEEIVIIEEIEEVEDNKSEQPDAYNEAPVIEATSIVEEIPQVSVVDTPPVDTAELVESVTSDPNVVIEYVTETSTIEADISSSEAYVQSEETDTVIVEITKYVVDGATETQEPIESTAIPIVERIVNPVVEQVQHAAAPIVEKVEEVIDHITKPIIDNVVQPVVDQVVNYGIEKDIVGSVESVVEEVIPTDSIIQTAESVIEVATSSVGSVLEEATEATNIIEVATEAASSVSAAAVNEATEVAEQVSQATEKVIDQASTVSDQVVEIISSVSEDYQGPIETVTEVVYEAVESVVENISQPIADVVEKVSEPIHSVVDRVSEPVQSIVDQVTKSVESVAEQEVESTAPVVEENPVSSVAENVQDTVSTAVEQVREPVESVVEQVTLSAESSAPASTPSSASATKSKVIRTKTKRIVKKIKRTKTPSAPEHDEL